VFGGLGFANQLAFLSTNGRQILGLSSNGLLSLISLVVGIVLIAAAVIGGHLSSTVTAAIGGLFLLSGLANLAVLDTPLNLLAFKIQNVLFSLVAGMAMLFVGLYGRVSGGLPSDNPYVRAAAQRGPRSTVTRRSVPPRRYGSASPRSTRLARAEFAMAEGRCDPRKQERLIRADARKSRRAAPPRGLRVRGRNPTGPTRRGWRTVASTRRPSISCSGGSGRSAVTN